MQQNEEGINWKVGEGYVGKVIVWSHFSLGNIPIQRKTLKSSCPGLSLMVHACNLRSLGSRGKSISVWGVGKNVRPYMKNNYSKNELCMSQVLKCLSLKCKQKSLSSSPSTTKKFPVQSWFLAGLMMSNYSFKGFGNQLKWLNWDSKKVGGK
jgi:hypothetical protein